MKRIFLKLICITFIFLITFSYYNSTCIAISTIPDKVLVSGEFISIDLISDYIIVRKSQPNTQLKPLDCLVSYSNKKIKNKKINNLNDFNNMVNIIEKNNTLNLTIIRNNKYKTIKVKKHDLLDIKLIDNAEFTATLTCINPHTKEFFAVGHSLNFNKYHFPFKSGKVYNVDRFNINTSNNYNIPCINVLSKDTLVGDVKFNLSKGIVGKLSSSYMINNLKSYEVSEFNQIKLGEAYILTQSDISNKSYPIKININKIYEYNDDSLNSFIFKIIDTSFSKKHNVIPLGMSGSPIIQNNKIIGVLSSSMPNKILTGRGIFIRDILN